MPDLAWNGLSFECRYTWSYTPSDGVYGPLDPYEVERWVVGKVADDFSRIEQVGIGMCHLHKLTRPAANMTQWTSDDYVLEWVWRAQGVPLQRIERSRQYTNTGSEADWSRSRLVSLEYHSQTMYPIRPAAGETTAATSSF